MISYKTKQEKQTANASFNRVIVKKVARVRTMKGKIKRLQKPSHPWQMLSKRIHWELVAIDELRGLLHNV